MLLFLNKKSGLRKSTLKMIGYGGDDGTRTHYLSLAKAALSQLSYIPTLKYWYISSILLGVKERKLASPQCTGVERALSGKDRLDNAHAVKTLVPDRAPMNRTMLSVMGNLLHHTLH